MLISGIDLNNQDYDVSSIDAENFPYLKLKMENADLHNYSPYQLRYWMVNYTPVPEGAIAPNIYFSSKDTVESGVVITSQAAIRYRDVLAARISLNSVPCFRTKSSIVIF